MAGRGGGSADGRGPTPAPGSERTRPAGVPGPHGAPEPLTARWAPGTAILWRYRDHTPAGPGSPAPVHICRPVTVVRDTPELLAVWMAPGTECVKPILLDGTSVHDEPLATRYTAPRTTTRSRWFGEGVLKLARPGDPWSVWLFRDHAGRFKNWYVNLEDPLRRWSGGVDSVDHFLDIVVDPDRSWSWRDEDEFEQAQRVGLIDAEQADRVRRAGLAAVSVIEAWGPPFDDGWEDWRPDPAWTVPILPTDWDRTPAHMTP
ncbi:cytidylyl-2-hydroxypropylphosphonate hydrolase [Streptomyces sp. BI20]|uniref:cytidylyl-2-hydroxypropylphosphonate hydrolase n=1 Tax=Streptomyces sp. BI20 TaxID=3403460 RepID=UPI003C7295CC